MSTIASITTTFTTYSLWREIVRTVQNGSVVRKERLVLNTNEVVVITTFPDTSSDER